MRVLHVYRTYFPDPPGGLQEAIRQIALACQAEGVQSEIFALSPAPQPTRLERPEGRVIRSRSWAAPASCDLGGPLALRRFAKAAAAADVLQVHFPWPFADLLLALARPRAPVIVTYQSDIVRQRLLGRLYAPLMRRTLRRATAVVATSPAYAASSPVLQQPWLQDKLRVIPLGIVEASYATTRQAAAAIDPKARFAAAFATLGAGTHDSYFLALGVLRYYKGLSTLVEAAALSRQPVLIAGDGPERAALERQAHRLGAPVAFTGRVSDAEKLALLRQCLALVLPSHLRSEAFGMVLVEAAMLGRPLVSCEIGTGTSYVNRHEETGLVVPPADAKALAGALGTLAADPARAAHYGRQARARFEALFSGRALGRAYAGLYEDVARDAAGRGPIGE